MLNQDNDFKRVRRAVLRFAANNSRVSAADIRLTLNVAPELRGTLVSSVFRSLIRDGRLASTTKTVRNPDTRHNVCLYRVR